jgi:sorting nexin-8
MQRKQSFGFDADPWASPDLHRNHNHPAASVPTPQANGIAAPSNVPQRTTSSFTTTSAAPIDSDVPNRNSTHTSGSYGAGWGEYNSTANSFRDSGLGGGFGESASGSGDGNRDPTGLGAPITSSRMVNSAAEETITITTIQEMEGTMFFQHRNYQVASARRNTKVIRRYSDFVWLLDCLHKRYPFRQLPLLPPKRVASEYHPGITAPSKG